MSDHAQAIIETTGVVTCSALNPPLPTVNYSNLVQQNIGKWVELQMDTQLMLND